MSIEAIKSRLDPMQIACCVVEAISVGVVDVDTVGVLARCQTCYNLRDPCERSDDIALIVDRETKEQYIFVGGIDLAVVNKSVALPLVK